MLSMRYLGGTSESVPSFMYFSGLAFGCDECGTQKWRYKLGSAYLPLRDA
jgi:hypothetical protein